MGKNDNDRQVFFVAGVIVGVTVLGLMIASGPHLAERIFSEWQTLLVGSAGLLVTLYGARLIAHQIRADDVREEQRQRIALEEVAESIMAEVMALQTVLYEKGAVYNTLGSLNAQYNVDPNAGSFPIAKFSESDKKKYFKLRDRRVRIPDVSRLDIQLEKAGVIGAATASQIINYRDLVARIAEQNRYDVFRPLEAGGQVEYAGLCGEQVLLSLRRLIEFGTRRMPGQTAEELSRAFDAHLRNWWHQIGEWKKML